MNRNYELALPEGYAPAYTVDAKNKKTTVLMNLAAVLITSSIIGAVATVIRPRGFIENFNPLKWFAVAAALLVYTVLHELTHGAAYKILTKQKLTFGVSFTVAFCGVPQIFVYRRAALISLLAPFTVFTLVFGVAVLLLQDAWDKMYALFLLASHIGGCVGDLYDTFLFVFRFRDPTTLVNDTRPKQTIFIKCNKS
ncbi:MAG: DUF3267 domain-containing protein [Clostridia bacterium]|nr:DUF3267 domain-containing protein [Clostridia bacterium]